MKQTCWFGLVLMLFSSPAVVGAEPAPQDVVRFRRPIAACALQGSERLCVANRDSGSITLVDTGTWAVMGETVVGARLSALAPLAEPGLLLALDEAESTLLVLRVAGLEWEVLDRVAVPATPVSIVVDDSGTRISVASLWSRRLTVFDVDADASARSPVRVREAASVELPFAPRLQCREPGGDRIIVADAFAGQLAVVDFKQAIVTSRHEVPGHNIRGLACSADGGQLFIAHQMLNPGAGTTYDDIHWGDLAENVVRVLPLQSVLDASADLTRLGRTILIGTTGNGAGDPGVVLPLEDGRLLAVASGVDRAEVFPMSHSVVSPWLETGRRPTDVVLAPGGAQAVILNTLDDSLTVIELASEEILTTVSLGPTPVAGPVERGESLFYDSRLSHDNWISCHSCHTDGHSNGLLVDTTSDGTLGTPKRVLSLLGTRDNNPWAWNGSLRSLHDQVRHSVTASMQGLRPTPRQVMDLVAYLHTLDAPPGIAPASVSEADAELLRRGGDVFEEQQCGRCHVPPLTYTSDQLVDVGLEDERGATMFNPPSLRGVSQQPRFFHDGRAESLRAVFEEHGHQLETGLDEAELRALVRFLESL